jgi:hypothetical protein
VTWYEAVPRPRRALRVTGHLFGCEAEQPLGGARPRPHALSLVSDEEPVRGRDLAQPEFVEVDCFVGVETGLVHGLLARAVLAQPRRVERTFGGIDGFISVLAETGNLDELRGAVVGRRAGLRGRSPNSRREWWPRVVGYGPRQLTEN